MWMRRDWYEVLLMEKIRLTTEVAHYRGLMEQASRELDEWKQRAAEERRRADEAVDRMLQAKGLPPVSPPPKSPTLDQLSELFAEDPAEVKEIVDAIKQKGPAEVLLESK